MLGQPRLRQGATSLVSARVDRAADHLARRLVAIGAGAVVLAPLYVLAGPHVFDQVRSAAGFVSLATPWRPLAEVLDARYGETTSRRIIGAAALVVAVLLALLLARALPPGQPVVRVTLALMLAYVLVAPYALPWYDAAAWALLGLLPAGRFDALLVAHTGVLSLAYLPGRVVPLPDERRPLTHP